MKNFHKYYNKNQAGEDCAIMSALNASRYLHGKYLFLPNSVKYDHLLELTGCRYGAAILPEKCYPLLKIKVKKVYPDEWKLKYTDLPLELDVWHSHYGFYSVLIVDYCKKTQAVQILNFRQETTTDGWIFIEKLKYFIKRTGGACACGEETEIARSFEKL